MMDATSQLVVGLDERGRSALRVLRAESPLLMRVSSDASASDLTVHLVGGAAGPLCGDHFGLDISLLDRARLTVRSVAASLAQPGPNGASGSVAAITAWAGAGSELAWRPEPLVSVRGSDHTQITRIQLADHTTRLDWVDEIVLGRHHEPSGRLTVHQRVVVDASPVLHHVLTFGPTPSIGAHGPRRFVITAIRVDGSGATGPEAGAGELSSGALIEPGLRATRVRLSNSATAWTVLADDLDRARSALIRLGHS